MANESVADFVRNASFGALTGAVIDAATEISEAPLLNDQAPFFNNPNMSTAEAIVYSTAALGVVGGLIDMGTGMKALGGYGQEVLATSLGLLVGTYVYENDLAEKLGIRKADAVDPAAAEAPPM
jgi:hypothetical protein